MGLTVQNDLFAITSEQIMDLKKIWYTSITHRHHHHNIVSRSRVICLVSLFLLKSSIIDIFVARLKEEIK